MFCVFFFFFFNDTATTEIYTLSLHDALPISLHVSILRSYGGSRKGSATVGASSRVRAVAGRDWLASAA